MGYEGPEGDSMYSSTLSLTSVIDVGLVSATSRPLYAREIRSTHCVGGRVGPQGQSGQGRKTSPPPDFDPLTVQPVASRYTEYVIPAHQKLINFLLNTGF
jgi:hypothetical protein